MLAIVEAPAVPKLLKEKESLGITLQTQPEPMRGFTKRGHGSLAYIEKGTEGALLLKAAHESNQRRATC